MGNISNAISVLGIAVLATGCASAPYPAGNEASEGQLVQPHDNREFSFERKATGVSHAAWVYARSVYENPVNRPVSHAASLGSLALKSTGGLLRRVAIGVDALETHAELQVTLLRIVDAGRQRLVHEVRQGAGDHRELRI